METHTTCRLYDGAIHEAIRHDSILVIEDPFIQKYLHNVLSRRGYHVVRTDARRASAMLESSPEEVSLVITNSPRDFLAFAATVPMLYMAGAPDLELAAQFRCCRAMRKPFHPDELLQYVEDLTATV
ncbi:MAG TPA: hypothetical protein VKU19_42655 [Bryobacteraceae bacterium]|nr:hypothetical protein [Bryobacteraceae bacterium]